MKIDCKHVWREATISGINARPFMYCDLCNHWLVIDKLMNIKQIMEYLKDKQDRAMEYMYENNPFNNPYLTCKHKCFVKYCKN